MDGLAIDVGGWSCIFFLLVVKVLLWEHPLLA